MKFKALDGNTPLLPDGKSIDNSKNSQKQQLNNLTKSRPTTYSKSRPITGKDSSSDDFSNSNSEEDKNIQDLAFVQDNMMSIPLDKINLGNIGQALTGHSTQMDHEQMKLMERKYVR